jgi:membrane-bound inhibitor of C-type lysozyme
MKKLHTLPFLAAATLAACTTSAAKPPVSYTCTGGFEKVVAEYPRDTVANLTLTGQDGTTSHSLAVTRAASGVRYTNATTAPAKPGDLVWWTKGAEAILYVATPSESNPGVVEEKQIAVCTNP